MNRTIIIRLSVLAASAFALGACSSEPTVQSTTTTHQTTTTELPPQPAATQTTTTTVRQ